MDMVVVGEKISALRNNRDQHQVPVILPLNFSQVRSRDPEAEMDATTADTQIKETKAEITQIKEAKAEITQIKGGDDPSPKIDAILVMDLNLSRQEFVKAKS